MGLFNAAYGVKILVVEILARIFFVEIVVVNIVAVESVVPTRNMEYLMYMICLIFKSVNYIFCIFFSGKLLIRTKRTNTNSIGIISEP